MLAFSLGALELKLTQGLCGVWGVDVAQLVECWPRSQETLGVVVHTYNPCTWEAWCHSWIHSESETSLCYMRAIERKTEMKPARGTQTALNEY